MRRTAAKYRLPLQWAAIVPSWQRLSGDLAAIAGLLALLAALLLYAATSPPTRLTFAVDQPPAPETLRYFYPSENNGEFAYWWTEPRATIQLPVSRPGTYRITLTLLAGATVTPRPVTIALDDRTLASVTIDAPPRDVVVEATITPQAWKDDEQRDLDLTLIAPPLQVSNDPRPLGVVVTRVAIAPQRLPAPWQPALLVANALLLVIAYGALRAAGTSRGAATGALGVVLAAYAILAALARDEALALCYTLALAPLRPLIALGLLLGTLSGVRYWLRHRATPQGRTLLMQGSRIAALYALITVAMTWPLALNLHTQTAPGGDPPLQLWIARWVQHALVTNPLNLYNANVFYPYPTTLAYSDANLPMSLLHWPLFLLTGDDLVAFNLLTLGTFVLAAVGMWALVLRLTRNHGAAFLAGLAFAFLPARFAHLMHLNLLSHAWMPWVVLALLVLLQRQQWRWSVVLGLGLAIQALCSFYFAAQLLIVVGIIVLVALIADRRVRTWRGLSRLALAGGIALLLVIPFAWPHLMVSEDLGLVRRIEESTAAGRSATLNSYRKVMDETPSWPGLLPLVDESIEDILYPGGVVLLGAAVGIASWRRRRVAAAFLLVALVALLLSFGPTLRLPGGGTLPSPYIALYELLPLFRGMRVPARFGMLADFALVVLAAGGAAAIWRRLARRVRPARRPAVALLATAILATAMLAEIQPVPVQLNRLDRSPETTAPYRWLGTQPDSGAVLDLPVFLARFNRAELMYGSTYHWRPLIQGYSGFLPPDYWERLNPLIRDLAVPNQPVSREVSYIDGENIALVRNLGVRYIILHRDYYRAQDWPIVRQLLEQTGAAELAVEFNDDAIYRLK